MSILVVTGLKVPRGTRPKSNISTIEEGTFKEGTIKRDELSSSLAVHVHDSKQANFHRNERACGDTEWGPSPPDL